MIAEPDADVGKICGVLVLGLILVVGVLALWLSWRLGSRYRDGGDR